MESEAIKRIYNLLALEKAAEAKKAFDELQPSELPEYLMAKGKIAQKFQEWGEAMNAYHRVLDLHPDHQEAKNSLHLIQNILNFWNPEMFNP